MLAAEIISVGDRLLTPFFTDTDSLWLTEQLNGIGIEVKLKTTIGNDEAQLTGLLGETLARSRVIIVLSEAGAAEHGVAYQSCLRLFNQSDNSQSDSRLLDRSQLLVDEVGSVPGMVISQDDKRILLLPAALGQLEPLFEKARPLLAELSPPFYLRRRILKVLGLSESAVDAQIAPIYTHYQQLTTIILFFQAEVHLRLAVTAESEAAAEQLLDEVSAKIGAKLGKHLFAWHGETLAEVIAAALAAKARTLAVLDNCSGGVFASRLTEAPASEQSLRQSEIGMPAPLLDKILSEKNLTDPVSAAAAEALAVDIRDRSGAMIGLALTGVVEAAQADTEHPVGLVYLALADENGVVNRRFQLPPDRERCRGLAAIFALDLLRRRL